MCNLEELALLIQITRERRNDFIDGKHLENDFLSHLPQLREFRFSIHTSLFYREAFIDQPSNVDVQRSFSRNIFKCVGSYVDHYPARIHSTCHVYSLPFAFDAFTRGSQSFPGGTFSRVRMVRIVEYEPLEYGFMVKIAKSFPYLSLLVLSNSGSPLDQGKHERTADMPVIIFPHLKSLNFDISHTDNLGQFLSDAFTSLPSLRELNVDYDQLSVLTNSFANDLARLNCANVRILGVKRCFVPHENFFSYFPSLKTLEKWIKLLWSMAQ